MNKLVSGPVGCAVYLDDVLISIDTDLALFDHLAWVCPTINLKQYEFAQATVNYLGKLVGQRWERPVSAKLDCSFRSLCPTSQLLELR